MNLIQTKSTTAHWYRQNDAGIWEPMYECPKKDGNGMKKVTLREARELSLVPSVTSILNVMAKPALESWKQEQAILAAVTLPHEPDEPLDVFCRRVIEDMEAQSEKAKDFGSRIHDAIEGHFHGNPIPFDLEPWLASFTKWAINEIEAVHQTEFIVGNQHYGYAGRLDIDADLQGHGTCLIDVKTQRIKTNGKGIKQPVWYDEWPVQLVAYVNAYPHIRGAVSVIVDSSEPGPIFVKQWPMEDFPKYWNVFESCLNIWRYLNNYDTRKL